MQDAVATSTLFQSAPRDYSRGDANEDERQGEPQLAGPLCVFGPRAGDPIIVRFAPAAKSLSVRPEEACSRLEKLLIHFDAENCRKIIASQSAFKLP